MRLALSGIIIGVAVLTPLYGVGEPPAEGAPPKLCVDRCGDGVCQEIVCLGEGCPCAETPKSCPTDCPPVE